MVFKYLCIDSGVIIRGHGRNLHSLADRIVTIKEVLNEIKDEKSRLHLASLPFNIEVMEPSSENLNKIIKFAKDCGDYAALSITDLKLLALVYTLEASIAGESHLRLKPKSLTKLKVQSMRKEPSNKAEPINLIRHQNIQESSETASQMCCSCIEVTEADEFFLEPDDKNLNVEDHESPSPDNFEEQVIPSEHQLNLESDEILVNSDNIVEDLSIVRDQSAFLSIENSALQCDHVTTELISQDISPNAEDSAEMILSSDVTSLKVSETEIINDATDITQKAVKQRSPYQSRILNRQVSSSEARSEDDGIGWVSVDNYRNSYGFGRPGFENDNISNQCEVACMTADFAMQNILMQIGLRIASFDGKIIRSVKSWVLRCNGCYKIHYDMERLFCSKCGLNYLSKIGCHIDSKTGELILHLKKNYHHNLRGTKYSLPSPSKHGRFEGDLLLREDQLLSGIWKQKTVKIRKDIKSAFGEDITEDVGISINKGLKIAVGFGTKNPNAIKGRERRGKKKSNL